jgi:hypothetical protein
MQECAAGLKQGTTGGAKSARFGGRSFSAVCLFFSFLIEIS